MNYIIVKNNNESSKGFGKFYARASYIGFINTDQLAEIIQQNCSMKKSDVQAVLTELTEVMQDKLQEGYKVKLTGLGVFKIGLRTAPADSPEDFTVAKNIKDAHVNFLPAWTVNSATGERKTALLSGLKVQEAAKNIY